MALREVCSRRHVQLSKVQSRTLMLGLQFQSVLRFFKKIQLNTVKCSVHLAVFDHVMGQVGPQHRPGAAQSAQPARRHRRRGLPRPTTEVQHGVGRGEAGVDRAVVLGCRGVDHVVRLLTVVVQRYEAMTDLV